VFAAGRDIACPAPSLSTRFISSRALEGGRELCCALSAANGLVDVMAYLVKSMVFQLILHHICINMKLLMNDFLNL
jgi:hypothetical protein